MAESKQEMQQIRSKVPAPAVQFFCPIDRSCPRCRRDWALANPSILHLLDLLSPLGRQRRSANASRLMRQLRSALNLRRTFQRIALHGSQLLASLKARTPQCPAFSSHPAPQVRLSEIQAYQAIAWKSNNCLEDLEA